MYVLATLFTLFTVIDTAPFDIESYLGLWYEVARYDNRFERDLECVTALYTQYPDGHIEVHNRGYNSTTEEWSSATGRVKRTNEAHRLKVSFFWIFYSQYNILALGEYNDRGEYSWALVGSKSMKYLWILSRARTLDKEMIANIEQIATSLGYDTSLLLYIDQRCK